MSTPPQGGNDVETPPPPAAAAGTPGAGGTEPELPWYKKYQGTITIILLLVIAGLVAVIVVLVVQNDSDDGNNGGSAAEGNIPTPRALPPTTSPTKQEGSTVDPSAPITAPPSRSPTESPTNSPSKALPGIADPSGVPPPVPPPPTVGPTRSRDAEGEAIGDRLATITPGGNAVLLDESTPYHEAWMWLVYEDGLMLTSTSDNLHQRYVMRLISNSLSQPDNDVFERRLEGWGSGAHECEGEGVTCRDADEMEDQLQGYIEEMLEVGREDGIKIDVPVRVVHRLELRRRLKDGGLPGDLSLLYYLQHLDLEDNGIIGELPRPVYQLFNLQTLFLEQNELTDVDGIGEFRHLEHLSLSKNNFMGPLPDTFKNLNKLKTLYLHTNRFTGEIFEVLKDFTDLELLDIAFNEFDGTIPTEIGNMKNLASAFLGHNRFNGEIPTEIGNCVNLREFQIDGSHEIRGPIPGEIGRLSKLELLKLDTCAFTGRLPDSLGDLANLAFLDVNSNELEGSIPTSLGRATSLKVLSLANNDFEGQIPSELGMLTQLEKLYLQNTGISGAVPQEVCALRSGGDSAVLQELFVPCSLGCDMDACCTRCSGDPDPNAPTATTTAATAAATGLTNLFYVNSTIGRCVQSCDVMEGPPCGGVNTDDSIEEYDDVQKCCQAELWYLPADDCASSPTLVTLTTEDPTQLPSAMPTATPSAMPSSVRFTEVVKKLKTLSGDALLEAGSPQYMAAQWMADADPFPNPSSPLGRGLDLDDPRFEQRYIMALFYYAMDGNNWKNNQRWLGEQSECFWFGVDGASEGCGGEGRGGCIKRSDFVGDYDKVCRLGMGRLNNLYGEIPSEMGRLTEMRWFEIQDDYLIGTLPDTLGTGWRKLHTLLLGGNYLSGAFPDTFEDNELLGTIFIDRNKFVGTFPRIFATLKNLEWLDAETNNFLGEIPTEIGNLKSLRILDVSHNSMSGQLPDNWDESNLIEDFVVADNKFSGPLPASLGKARFLKDLRASRNQLTGEIPVSYYSLEYLQELYLDENELGGELPQQAQPFYDGLQELSIHSNNFFGRFPIEHFESTLRLKVISLHNNELIGTITENICNRRNSGNYLRLIELTADCEEVACDCCSCYRDGLLVSEYSPPATNSPTATPTTKINAEIKKDLFLSRPTRAPSLPTPDRDFLAMQAQIESTVLMRSVTFDGMDANDPRQLAMAWIFYDDTMQLTTDDENLSQRYILALLAYALDSLAWYVCGDRAFEGCEVLNQGTMQIESHKVWLSGADECHWYGVICSSDGVVKGLELIGNDLIGEIPPEISQLNQIQYMALSGNCLYGTIAPELGQMQELLSLELHGNGLSGELPLEMYDMTQLQLLNVAMQFQYSNQCTKSDGTPVNTLYKNGGTTGLLEYNTGLLGEILGPNIGKLTDLKGLHVLDNSFHGTIADEIGDLRNLTYLRANNNVIGGLIPNGTTRLTKLRQLYLTKNEIRFDLPPEIGQMKALEDFRVNENEMSGMIPDSLYNLPNVTKLWLHDTLRCQEVAQTAANPSGWLCDITSDSGFTGTLSTEVGNLKRLSHLLLNNNPLSGTLPTQLGLCEDLSLLYIHKTNIEGSVPEEVCLLRDKKLYNEEERGVFYADCRPNNRTQDPFLRCDCCSDCCDHTLKVCIADD